MDWMADVARFLFMMTIFALVPIVISVILEIS